jgi:hypothetical protein
MRHISYALQDCYGCYDMNYEKLYIKAQNYENCDIISSLLQDSIFHIHSPSFHENNGCLRLLLNRFCWELTEESTLENSNDETFFRVHSGLYIDNVNSIVINDNFKKIKQDKYLNLLTMHVSSSEINILFSEHRSMCIKINGICVYLKDLHDRYPTSIQPKH